MTHPLTPQQIYERHVSIFESAVPLLFKDMPVFRARVERGLKLKNTQHATGKLELLDSNFFSKELLEALLSGGESFSPLGMDLIWQRLEDAKIVVTASGAMPYAPASHHLDVGLLARHLFYDTLHNIFFPPANLSRRYAGAIVAVDVEKNGDLSRGSGFIINNPKNQKDYLVTCRHNVDSSEGVTIKRIAADSGKILAISDLVLSSRYDVAIAPLLRPADSPPFYLCGDVEIFDDVYTLGFPNLPGTLPVLLGHRGEVNARAELYAQHSPALIISNLASPGSSGCPVLSRAGRPVGMTIRWPESEWEQDQMRFSSALPSSVIQEVLDSETSNSAA